MSPPCFVPSEGVTLGDEREPSTSALADINPSLLLEFALCFDSAGKTATSVNAAPTVKPAGLQLLLKRLCGVPLHPAVYLRCKEVL